MVFLLNKKTQIEDDIPVPSSSKSIEIKDSEILEDFAVKISPEKV